MRGMSAAPLVRAGKHTADATRQERRYYQGFPVAKYKRMFGHNLGVGLLNGETIKWPKKNQR